MLDVDIRFIRGVLVVTLEGRLNNNSITSVRNNLRTIIKASGIKYLMFNIDECMLEEEIDMFSECDNLIKENNGRMYICGLINHNYIKQYNTVDNVSSGLKLLEGLKGC